jgi:hypothetical protein
MRHTFTITLKGDPQTTFDRACQKARARGVSITGTKDEGRFRGMLVTGEYKLAGQDLTLTVDRIPFMATPEFIEAELKKFFEEA